MKRLKEYAQSTLKLAAGVDIDSVTKTTIMVLVAFVVFFAALLSLISRTMVLFGNAGLKSAPTDPFVIPQVIATLAGFFLLGGVIDGVSKSIKGSLRRLALTLLLTFVCFFLFDLSLINLEAVLEANAPEGFGEMIYQNAVLWGSGITCVLTGLIGAVTLAGGMAGVVAVLSELDEKLEPQAT